MSSRSLLLLACLTLGGCTALGKMGQVIMNPSIPVGGPDDQLSQFSLSLYASPTINTNPNSAVIDSAAQAPAHPLPLAVSLSAGDPLELTYKLQAVIEHVQQEFPAASGMDAHASPAPLAMSPATPALASYEDALIQLGLPADSSAPLPDQVTTPVAFKVLQLRDDSLLLTAPWELLGRDLEKALGSTLVQADDYRLMPGQFKFVNFEQIDQDTRYLAVIANYHDRDNTEWKRALRIEPRGRQHALLIQFDETGVVLKREG